MDDMGHVHAHQDMPTALRVALPSVWGVSSNLLASNQHPMLGVTACGARSVQDSYSDDMGHVHAHQEPSTA